MIVCLGVCLFVSNKRQNGWTDRAQTLRGISHYPRVGSQKDTSERKGKDTSDRKGKDTSDRKGKDTSDRKGKDTLER